MKETRAFSKAWIPLAAILFSMTSVGGVLADTTELENFIRARIEIGETMKTFMREQAGADRSMENMKKMEADINGMVAEILGKYGMTIEEYRERSPKVFEDEAAVQAFLDAHPDLKKRYEVLPLHQASERRGPPKD